MVEIIEDATIWLGFYVLGAASAVLVMWIEGRTK
jgi:hypothetical protein